MYKYFDIEADGLDPTQVWCIVVNGVRYDKDQIDMALEDLGKGTLVGHNILDYDLPVLNRLYGFEYDKHNVIDTIVLSRLYKSDRHGGHGLEAWGHRVGVEKLPDLDWLVYDPAMLERCEVDVHITKLTHEYLMAEAKGHDWNQAIEIEQLIAHYHQRQWRNGVQFNVEAAIKVADTIEGELNVVRDFIGKQKNMFVIWNTT